MVTFRRSRGFTLIELLIVVVIITVLSTLVGSFTVERLDKIRRTDEIKNLHALISQQQFLAFISGKSIRIKLEGRGVYRHASDADDMLLKQFSYLTFEKQFIEISRSGYLLSHNVVLTTLEGPVSLALDSSIRVEDYEAF
ncbi:type II secretion system protein [Shewanella sp. FJAT-52076]|uniref:type II secretion system protein n=1 Tax=Shewanella sp. FJAT-52076 TaxID=2864202 RepID=UPI001C65BD67|nr:type II secretion system protein [Shewanella sp. FJAT-52076]QYJ74056.1 type II secretion system GspH family protein [Shewanella sp. FJAT-52076]